MKKTILIPVLVLFILLLGGGAYMFVISPQLSREKEVQPTPDDHMQQNIVLDDTSNAAEPITKENGTAGAPLTSLRAVLETGQSMRCTFSHSDEYSTQSGVAYVNTNRLRGDLTITQEGSAPQKVHVLVAGGWAYTWGASFEEGTGIKLQMSLDALDTVPEDDGSNLVEIDEEVDYTCTPWDEDASMFIAPTDITFKDYSVLGTPLTDQADTAAMMREDADCSICDEAPGSDAQEECLAALGC